MSQTIGEAIKLAYEHEGKINDILNNYMTTDTPQTVTGAKYFPNGKAMFENYIIASGYTISFPQRNGEIALDSDIDSIRANYVAWIQGIPSVTYGSEIVSYVFNVYNNRNQGSQNILQNFSFTIISATDSQAGLMSAADKVKVNNIASDIATALSTAKTYTDGKTERTYLVNTIGEATTSQSGLLSAADKTKINNIAGDISTALNAAKTYTDSKVARENLVAVLGEATTTLNGLMSATDKERLNTLYALLGERDDPDQFVNTISEILKVFETYPEGTNIATVLAGKINYSDVIDNLNSNETVKPLSANQGRILKGMVDQKVSSYSNDQTQWDTTPTSGSTKPVTSGGVKAADDALAADIGNLETAVSALETGKADKSDTFNKTEIEGFLAAKADKATTYALLAGKQDTLVSGENIKTINGTSLLGSGDYAFDTALNEASTNAVQNKAIAEYITDLESKVSTLAVKVYNHDIALGTLNIENTLYSVENTDSFAIPSTVGTNADVVIPKSRMALNTIKGKTEYSRNIIQNSEQTFTFNNTNKWLYLSLSQYCSEGAIYTIFVEVDNPNIYVQTLPKYTIINNESYTFTYSSTDSSAVVNIRLGRDTYSEEYANVKIKVMLVKGATTLTADSYVPYYTGLKNVELNSLNVYGKTDNYTELRVGDKVTNFTISFGRLWFQETGSLETNNVVWISNNTTIYLSKSALSDIGVSMIKINGIDVTLTGQHMVEEGDLITIDKVLTTSQIKYFTGALTKFQNATSVKSILPSSILPKTLASYERLEVVDNGDDTYKIDLVSHAELHVGDEINSLWVGNPQADDFPTTGYSALGLGFNVPSGDMDWWVPSASVGGYDRIILTNGNTYISNLEDLLDNKPRLYFGGNDTFVDKVTTNRNVVVKFKNALTITTFENTLTELFRNGEETRTTLIDGLSLDDVSAVIDTGDIVYADNSNAEYDVSIAETSVELLVNKN